MFINSVLLYSCETWTLNNDSGGISKPLAPSTFARQWGITRITSCKTSDCVMKVNRGLLPA